MREGPSGSTTPQAQTGLMLAELTTPLHNCAIQHITSETKHHLCGNWAWSSRRSPTRKGRWNAQSLLASQARQTSRTIGQRQRQSCPGMTSAKRFAFTMASRANTCFAHALARTSGDPSLRKCRTACTCGSALLRAGMSKLWNIRQRWPAKLPGNQLGYATACYNSSESRGDKPPKADNGYDTIDRPHRLSSWQPFAAPRPSYHIASLHCGVDAPATQAQPIQRAQARVEDPVDTWRHMADTFSSIMAAAALPQTPNPDNVEACQATPRRCVAPAAAGPAVANVAALKTVRAGARAGWHLAGRARTRRNPPTSPGRPRRAVGAPIAARTSCASGCLRSTPW